jgi:hypothetical protein
VHEGRESFGAVRRRVVGKLTSGLAFHQLHKLLDSALKRLSRLEQDRSISRVGADVVDRVLQAGNDSGIDLRILLLEALGRERRDPTRSVSLKSYQRPKEMTHLGLPKSRRF